MITIKAILLFVLFSGAIILTARKISYYADYLGSVTGISKGFIGIFLLAAITSLPELFTSLIAVLTIEQGPELAAGNIFGSNCFNLVIIISAFLFFRLMPNIRDVQHLISGVFILIITLMLLLKTLYPPFMKIGYLDVSMWTILVLFFVSLWFSKNFGKDEAKSIEVQVITPIPWFALKLSVLIIIIVALSYGLTRTVDILSVQLKLGHSFGGYLFLAIATSLPELATTFSSLKYDINLALGNILGSNIFNPMILAFLQVILPRRNLTANFTLSNHLAIILSLILLSLVIGLLYYPKSPGPQSERTWRICLGGAIGIFIAASYAIFTTSIP